MEDVVIGSGSLDGHGVYADRDFAAGEVVVSYELKPLSVAQYRALPERERMFVHSYGGRRYLYPVPARYVNHADEPSTYQDFDRCCDIAARPIRRGEAITINAGDETDRELTTFLAAYERAVAGRSFAAIAPLIDDGAEFWLLDRPGVGKAAIGRAYEPAADDPVVERGFRVSAVRWMVASHRWEAVASYDFVDDLGATGERHVRAGHATLVLAVVEGNWQVVYEHADRTP